MSNGLRDHDERPHTIVAAGDEGDGSGPRRTGLREAFFAYLRSIKNSPRIESY